jgi:VIT1/CCC1 family predicted Fe2+/Mn2+ transporter
VPTSRLYISALTIGLSYFLGGLIPLLPYLFATSAEQGLIISCIVTGVVLLLFGAFKTYFTYVHVSRKFQVETVLMSSGATGGVGGYVYGATSTLFVGGIAAAAAFGLVKVLDPNAA